MICSSSSRLKPRLISPSSLCLFTFLLFLYSDFLHWSCVFPFILWVVFLISIQSIFSLFFFLALEKKFIGLQLEVVRSFPLHNVIWLLPPQAKVLFSCFNRKRIRTAYLAVEWKNPFQVNIQKFLTVRRGVNSCHERATELGISMEVISSSEM